MIPAEKNSSLRNFSKQVHVTNWGDVFYSNYYQSDTVLFHALDSVLLFDVFKIERLYVPKFYHHNNTVNFLNKLEYVGEFDAIDNVWIFNYPTTLDRKLYEYKKPAGSLKNVSIKTSDNDWSFLDTYFKSTGCTVRVFSFCFQMCLINRKIFFLLTTNLLNIESGTEETVNALTQNDFFSEQKTMKDIIDEYNDVPFK